MQQYEEIGITYSLMVGNKFLFTYKSSKYLHFSGILKLFSYKCEKIDTKNSSINTTTWMLSNCRRERVA